MLGSRKVDSISETALARKYEVKRLSNSTVVRERSSVQ